MEPVSQHIYFSLNTLARLLSRMADDHFKRYGLTTSYAFLILEIQRSDDDIRQKEICDRFHLAPSTMTRFVDKLIKKKLMKRGQDGKEVVLSLTDEGRDLSKKLEDELLVLNASINKIFGEKYCDTLNRMLLHGTRMIEES